MVINHNQFNGQAQQVNNTYNFYFNATPPQALPDPAPKKDKLAVFKKFMPIIFEVMKWILKFVPLLLPLFSG